MKLLLLGVISIAHTSSFFPQYVRLTYLLLMLQRGVLVFRVIKTTTMSLKVTVQSLGFDEEFYSLSTPPAIFASSSLILVCFG